MFEHYREERGRHGRFGGERHEEGHRGHGRCREGEQGEGRHERRMERRMEKMFAMMAMGRGPFGRGFMGHKGPGRGGFGDDGEFGPRGRFLGQGHIRLLVLSLIESEPRHGYDLIKQIEEMTGGAYAPSPGVIYPTLTFLEEAGFTATTSEANKKLYSITDEGKAHLDEHREHVRMILERLSALGEHMKARSERREREEGPSLPRGVDAAFMNLRDAVARKLGKDQDAATEIVRKLLAMAEELG